MREGLLCLLGSRDRDSPCEPCPGMGGEGTDLPCTRWVTWLLGSSPQAFPCLWGSAWSCGGHRGVRWVQTWVWLWTSWFSKLGPPPLLLLLSDFSPFLFTPVSLSSPHPWALPPPPGADEVPAQHLRSAGPQDAMCQSSARARPPLMRRPDPRPSLPQGEPAGDAARICESLRW